MSGAGHFTTLDGHTVMFSGKSAHEYDGVATGVPRRTACYSTSYNTVSSRVISATSDQPFSVQITPVTSGLRFGITGMRSSYRPDAHPVSQPTVLKHWINKSANGWNEKESILAGSAHGINSSAVWQKRMWLINQMEWIMNQMEWRMINNLSILTAVFSMWTWISRYQ